MRPLLLAVAIVLAGCAPARLVRECIHCGYGPEADLCGLYEKPCDRPYDHANCDVACHYADKCVAYCYSDTKTNPDGSSVVECCNAKSHSGDNR